MPRENEKTYKIAVKKGGKRVTYKVHAQDQKQAVAIAMSKARQEG